MVALPRSTSQAPWLSLALAVAGGYADAAVYLIAGAFSGHITGNSVLAMVHFAAKDMASGLLNLLAVATFLTGSFLAMLAHNALKARMRIPFITAAMLAEACLIFPIALCMTLGFIPARVVTILLACFALGIQNGALTQVGQASVHTTFITGMATSLLQDEATRTQNPETYRADAMSRGTLLRLGLCFLSGAAAAAYIHARTPSITLWPFIAGLLVLVLSDLRLNTQI